MNFNTIVIDQKQKRTNKQKIYMKIEFHNSIANCKTESFCAIQWTSKLLE